MQPLNGKILLSTASHEKSKRIKLAFEAKGMQVISLPMTNIVKADDNIQNIENQINKIQTFDWIAFTSSNGVKYFFEWLSVFQIQISANIKFAAIGQATALELKKYGFEANFVSKTGHSETFATELADIFTENRCAILVPTGNIASQNLMKVLSVKHHCEYMVVYNTLLNQEIKEENQAFSEQKKPDYILFMSPSAVKNFIANRSEKFLLDKKCISIGKTTEAALKSYKINTFFVPSEPNIEILANELETFELKNSLK